MKVGDIVKFQSDIQGMDGLRGIIIGENGSKAFDVYWYKDVPNYAHHKGNVIFNVRHNGFVVDGAYDLGWVEILFLDGERRFYDDRDPAWEDFFEVLNESR